MRQLRPGLAPCTSLITYLPGEGEEEFEELCEFPREAKIERAGASSPRGRDARRDGEQKARQIIVGAIQRLATEQTTESVVTTVPLPNDDMKGRIIGREGRNIRAIETLTGVDLIIDDTPEAITLSCFDAVRRELCPSNLSQN